MIWHERGKRVGVEGELNGEILSHGIVPRVLRLN